MNCPATDSPILLSAIIEIECAVSESISLRAGLANVHHATPIEQGKGTYPSIVTDVVMEMGQSTNVLAIAELAKKILSGGPMVAKIGNFQIAEEGIAGIISNALQIIQDESPSTILSTHLDKELGPGIYFFRGPSLVASISQAEPLSLQTIWIPIDATEFCQILVNFVIQFTAAGYPGCEGCLGPAFENIWDENTHRGLMDY